MTPKIIQMMDDDAQWQDIPVPFTEDIWDRIKDLKDGCAPILLRVIERETTETLVTMNKAAKNHQRHAEYIAALDSGDEE